MKKAKLWPVLMFALVMVVAIVVVRQTTVAGAEDPNIPAGAGLGRVVQVAQVAGVVDVNWADPDGDQIRVGAGTLMPPGMRLEIVANKLHITWEPGTDAIGIHQVIVQIQDITAHEGLSHTIVGFIEWHVVPENHAPFMSGIGDILIR